MEEQDTDAVVNASIREQTVRGTVRIIIIISNDYFDV